MNKQRLSYIGILLVYLVLIGVIVYMAFYPDNPNTRRYVPVEGVKKVRVREHVKASQPKTVVFQGKSV